MKARYKESKQLLHPTGGYLNGYSHSLNPYSGCAFACSYCYVRQMPVALFRGESWGEWLDVKQGAAGRLRSNLIRAKRKGPVTIFMSSSTDPYQPAEYKEKVTRSLLEVLSEERPDFLFVQTRSPLVTRDIDLFQALGDRLRISVTVETDREDIRKVFTPTAPPIAARLRALQQLAAAGLPVQAAIAPLLPCSEHFAERLQPVAERVVIDDYFRGDGSQGKRTERLHIRDIYERHQLAEWYSPAKTDAVIEHFRTVYPPDHIFFSQAGFLPDQP